MEAPAKTPAELGYRMPAEWEAHAATWLSWPRREGISFPDSFDRVMPTFRKMVEALVESEPVCINVCNGAHEAEARAVLDGIAPECITYYEIPTNEPWCRDHGPIFLTREQDPKSAIVDWDYNAWGGKYPPYELDEVVPTRIAELLDVPVFYPHMILEGGSIDVNGAGALLTSESCLLNPNRNPSLSRKEIEQRLRDFLGIREILWLGDGIAGDDTDGHIDDLARFVGERTVVTVVEKSPDDENFEPLQKNLERLREMKIKVLEGDAPSYPTYPGADSSPRDESVRLADAAPSTGKHTDRKLDIVELPMPRKMVREDQRLPASYANFYIANSCVLLPTFADPGDDVALSVLRDLFPGRRVIGIDCRELVWGLGAFHCLTQQQPAVR